ncbi:lipopolysaccharide/colanic/teichoic acid biosynthesis glycosyltransferase [Litoreibacter meonggei]|uniref:Lipopolysaccharide/colanic/teichoic acid biosynthesis glycosyltransferase n=1 Tax=Litoreibacter meonggei TaxID=1049199 RepID=A0A497UYR9_9RHOB|nr:sugar transferase [Litoreibacter meonggei]RLJ36190.1 lipopolysaccharide/colanic/teichoic acid biosynthesis glycosyltransferase [Litoreibacter meonggei]
MPFDINDGEYDAKLASHLRTLPSQRITNNPQFYRNTGKRVADIVLVVLTLPISLVLILGAALLVALDGGNPFYTQRRIGQGGREFRMLKLRTMVPNACSKLEQYLATNPAAKAEWDATQKLKNDPRITTIGRVLRKCSIDELPQLLNVLFGSMSLVGPRPMMVSQKGMYHGHGYYALRPGLTGFWQITDRNECDFRDRVQHDDAYNRSVSFATDAVVILRTFNVVLRGTGY